MPIWDIFHYLVVAARSVQATLHQCFRGISDICYTPAQFPLKSNSQKLEPIILSNITSDDLFGVKYLDRT